MKKLFDGAWKLYFCNRDECVNNGDPEDNPYGEPCFASCPDYVTTEEDVNPAAAPPPPTAGGDPSSSTDTTGRRLSAASGFETNFFNSTRRTRSICADATTPNNVCEDGGYGSTAALVPLGLDCSDCFQKLKSEVSLMKAPMKLLGEGGFLDNGFLIGIPASAWFVIIACCLGCGSGCWSRKKLLKETGESDGLDKLIDLAQTAQAAAKKAAQDAKGLALEGKDAKGDKGGGGGDEEEGGGEEAAQEEAAAAAEAAGGAHPEEDEEEEGGGDLPEGLVALIAPVVGEKRLKLALKASQIDPRELIELLSSAVPPLPVPCGGESAEFAVMIGMEVLSNLLQCLLSFYATLLSVTFDLIVVVKALAIFAPHINFTFLSFSLFSSFKFACFSLPVFDIILPAFSLFSFGVDIRLGIGSCLGISSVIQVCAMLGLIVPTFRIIESDFLLKAKIKWARFNWALVPYHRNVPAWVTKIYFAFQTKVGPVQPFAHLLPMLSGAIIGVAGNVTFKFVQLMIVLQSGWLVDLFGLLDRQGAASYGTCALGFFDTAILYITFLLWITVCAWPVLLFFMPMVYGTRDDDDWGRSRIFSALASKAEEQKATRGRRRSSVAVKPEPQVGCDALVAGSIGSMIAMDVGTEDERYAYRVGIIPSQLRVLEPVELPMKRCWGDDVEWLQSWKCIFRATTAIFGMYADCGVAVTTPCIKEADKKVGCLRGLGALRAYAHVLVSVGWSNLRRLLMLACGMHTEEIFEKYEILSRAAKVSSQKESSTHHEAVISLNARLHGLYFLFLPGCAMLAKMAEYLNEAPAIFFVGHQVREVDSIEQILKMDYDVCDTGQEPTDAVSIPLPNGRRMVLHAAVAANGVGQHHTVTEVLEDEGVVSGAGGGGELSSPPPSPPPSPPDDTPPVEGAESPKGSSKAGGGKMKDKLLQFQDKGSTVLKASGVFKRHMRDVRVQVRYTKPKSANSDPLSPAVAEPIAMTVRVKEGSERCELLNELFFYRDCRTGVMSRSGIDMGIMQVNWQYFLSLLKFFFFFLATVGLMIDQSRLATGAALFLCGVPIAFQKMVKQAHTFMRRVAVLLKLRALVAQTDATFIKALTTRVLAIKKLKDQAAKFMSFADFIETLSLLSPEAIAEKLEEMASDKYNCALEPEALEQMKDALKALKAGPDSADGATDGDGASAGTSRASKGPPPSGSSGASHSSGALFVDGDKERDMKEKRASVMRSTKL